MKNKGIVEMLAAMTICGTIGITVMTSGQTEVSLIFYRCLFGMIVLLGICFARKYLNHKLITSRLIMGSLIGGAALLGNWYFLFASYEKTSIGVATTIYNTQPIMMIILGSILFKEKITANIIIWTSVSLAGLLFISQMVGHDGIPNETSHYLIGVAQALIAAALYAVAALYARILKGYPPTLIALFQMTLGAVALWPFADLSMLISPTWDRQTFATVLLGVLHTGVMYILLYGALQKIEAYRAASISFIYPALAIFIDSVFLGVTLSLDQWAGIGLILLGAAGINLKWDVFRLLKKPTGVETNGQS
ncbi:MULTISPECIES: DMT family transporter [unclassified Brenneria]|uniref:DMT family transporter n=1 Tax=unclassified Brenneria TaxID=2634434 RepID=UPI0018F0F898|nr:DMT family transporter [Brenneria sp. L3-3C-1]MBJ7220373.1 DMT family transporter [Brenneria sp. L3-3C-1]MEE3641617.1 DMT family transporter [Brenneria sp. L3_3C_1]